MALTNAERQRAWRRFVEAQVAVAPGQPVAWTKADLAAAAGAINDWVDANQASFVSALNAGAPGFGGANSTATQKTLMFVYVLMVRQGLI